MRSTTVSPGQAGLTSQYNNLRADAYGGSMLLAHQQATPAMMLYVEPGVYYVGNTRVIFGGGNTPSFTAPTTNPRIDLVTADSSGNLAIVQGTEAASPSSPSYPTGKVIICEVYHVVGESALYDNDAQVSGEGYIANDVRPVNAPVYIADASQVAPDLFIPWIPSPAQGDIAYFDGAAWNRLAAGISGYVLQTKGAGANPAWGLGTIGHQILDGTGGSATINFDSTWQTIKSYTNLPALKTGQSLLFWARYSVLTSTTSETAQVRLSVGGNAFSAVSWSGVEGGPQSGVVMGIVSFPSSTSSCTGVQASGTTSSDVGGAGGSPNVGSAWQLDVQGWDNHGSGSGTFTLNSIYIAILG